MREHWGSRYGFILAVAGSAIGLGNIWKFPYICGMNGGGAFVLVYLICVLLVGFPLLLAELTMGRAAQSNTVAAFKKFSKPRTIFSDLLGSLLVISGASLLIFGRIGYGIFTLLGGIMLLLSGWRAIGFISGFFIPVVITGYYGVIGGWTLLYMGKSFLRQLNFSTQAEASAVMQPIAEASGGMMLPVLGCTILFILLCALILLSGVKKGIERWSKVLMPLLFCLLFVLILRGISLPGAKKGLQFFLSPDFSKLSASNVIAAMGHSFFSLSLAMGIVMTYGSYLNRKENIVKSALSVLLLDTMAAMMAGLAIFPAVFAMGFKETSGPVLVYEILPAAFNHIPGGWIWNGLFFMMIGVAALTSGISLLEPPVLICVEEFKWKRKNAVIIISLLCTAIGCVCALSMSNWNHLAPVKYIMERLWGIGGFSGSLFAVLDSFCCNWLLPLCGMLMSIYIGWIWGARRALKELRQGCESVNGNLWLLMAGIRDNSGSGGRKVSLFSLAVIWGFFIRLITPAVVFIAFLSAIGALKFG